MKITDLRVRKTNEVLDGIKVIKLYGWEDSFTDVSYFVIIISNFLLILLISYRSAKLTPRNLNSNKMVLISITTVFILKYIKYYPRIYT